MRGPNTSSEGRIGTVCFAAIAALLAGGAVGPGPRQELPERPIPILSLPYDVPRPADGDEAPDSGPEMAPTLLSISLSERPGSDAPREAAVEVLDAERVDELLARLPSVGGVQGLPGGPSGPPGDVDRSAPGGSGAGSRATLPSARDSAPLTVVSVHPRDSTDLARDVTIVFSQPMVPLGRDAEPIAGDPPARLEPAVEGSWRWLDPRVLRFEADRGRLPGGTEFTVTVPGGARSAGGAVIREDEVRHFRTSGPVALGGFPNVRNPDGGPTFHPRTPILLRFDQQVDPENVLASATLEADSARHPLRLMTLAELEAYERQRNPARRPEPSFSAGARQSDAGTWVVLRPQTPLPAGSVATLRLGPELVSAEGPIATGRAQTMAFRVHGPLILADHDCTDVDQRCPADGTVGLHFSNALDRDQDPTELVAITPVPDDLRLVVSGPSILLYGDFRPHSTYRAVVDASLEDEFGQRLGVDTQASIHLGGPHAFVSIPGAPFLALDPTDDERVQITFRSLPYVDVTIHPVQPSEWPAFVAEGMRSIRYRRDQEPWRPDSEPVRVRVDAPDGGPGYSSVSVELGDVLRNGVSHAVVFMEAPERDSIPWQSRRYVGGTRTHPLRAMAWVQSTSFSVGAIGNPEELVAWAVSTDDGSPAEGVEVRLPSGGSVGITGPDGLVRIPRGAAPDSMLVARRDGETAMLPGLVDRYLAGTFAERDEDFPGALFFAVSDRGLYRPGDTVTGYGWIREHTQPPRREISVPSRTTEVLYRLHQPRGGVVASGRVPLSASGAFRTDIPLPRTAASGSHRLEIVAMRGPDSIPAWRENARVRVEEYRRAEFEVSGGMDPGPHIAGATIGAEIAGRYYDGGGLRNASASWRVRVNPAGWTAPGWLGWSFGTPIAWNRGLVLDSTVAGTTDASGSHSIEVRTGSPAEPTALRVQAFVELQDLDRQVRSTALSTLVHPAAWAVGVRTKQRWVMVGEEITFGAAVVTLEGEPVPTERPRVRAVLEADSLRPNRATELDLPVTCSYAPGERVGEHVVRPLRCSFVSPDYGRVRFEAEVDDVAGRRSSTTRHLYVAAPRRPLWWTRHDPGRLELTADRFSYAPGDTARVRVTAPLFPIDGVLTVSRAGFREVRRVVIDSAAVELSVPIREEHAGGLTVRLDAGGPSRGAAHLTASVQVPVEVESRRLAVQVRGQPGSVRPGETTEVEVRVTDASGRPASEGEVAIWAVDESVLDLGSYVVPDPIPAMYPRGFSTRRTVRSPYAAVRWRRRPIGPGFVTGLIVDPISGQPPRRMAVRLEGTDQVGSVADGRFVFRDVAAGRYRLVAAPADGEPPFLIRTIDVPAEGLDLGLVRFGRDWMQEAFENRRMGSRALQLRGVVVTGAEIAQRREVGNSVDLVASVDRIAGLPPPPEAPSDAVHLRRDFRSLPAFHDQVPVGPDGRARVTIPMPDTPTRYRIIAFATEGATRFGAGEGAVTVSKPLLARAVPPRVLHPGDTPELPVVIQNASSDVLDVEVGARLMGASTVGPRGYRVSLAPGGRREVRFPLRAGSPGTARFEMLAVGRPRSGGPEHTDALSTPFEITPAVAPRVAATYRVLRPGEPVELPLEVPARARPDFGGVEVGLASSLLLPMTDVISELYLEPLPWPGPTSARLLAGSRLGHAIRTLGSDRLPTSDELARMIRVDSDRLSRWTAPYRWGHSVESIHPTNGVLTTFGALHAAHALFEAGAGSESQAGPSKLHRDWAAATSRHYRPSPETPFADARYGYLVSTYALYVAEKMGYEDPGSGRADWMRELVLADLPVEILAWLLAPSQDLEDPTVHAAILGEIENRALTTASTATLRQGGRARVGSADAPVQRLVLASSRQSDAIALATLLETHPDHPLVRPLARGLAAPRGGGDEGALGPFESGWALFALGLYAELHESDPVDLSVTGSLGGQSVAPLWVGPERPRSKVERALPTPGTRSSVSLRGSGTGTAYARAAILYTPDIHPELPTEIRGFMVSRRYEAVDDPGDVVRTEDGSWRIRAGARVRVRLALIAPDRRYQVEVDDPLPGGLEAINPDLSGVGRTDDLRAAAPGAPLSSAPRPYRFGVALDWLEVYFRWRVRRGGPWYTHRQLRDDRMKAYTSFLPAGSYETTYLTRAVIPGTYLVPPSRAHEIEAPETYGQGRVDRVVVEGG